MGGGEGDDDWEEVRVLMWIWLSIIYSTIGPAHIRLEVTKTHILHEISELLRDEEWCVRGAAVETLVGLIPSLDKGTVKDKAVPLLMQACDHALTQADSSLPILARLLGKICHELKGVCVSVCMCVCDCVCDCVCV